MEIEFASELVICVAALLLSIDDRVGGLSLYQAARDYGIIQS